MLVGDLHVNPEMDKSVLEHEPGEDFVKLKSELDFGLEDIPIH